MTDSTRHTPEAGTGCGCGIIAEEAAFDGSGEFRFCPLHAAATEMETLLRQFVDDWDEIKANGGHPRSEMEFSRILEDARVLLASIDQEKPQAVRVTPHDGGA